MKEYFTGLERDWQMIEYAAEHFVAQGDRVVMLGRCGWRYKKTGKVVLTKKVNSWRFAGAARRSSTSNTTTPPRFWPQWSLSSGLLFQGLVFQELEIPEGGNNERVSRWRNRRHRPSRLIGLLRDAGHSGYWHDTIGRAKLAEIEKLGGEGVAVNAFDADGLKRAVVAAQPDAVIHQLTDLPDVSDPAQMAFHARKEFAASHRRHAQSDVGRERPRVSAGSWRRASPSSMRREQGPRRETDPLDSSEAQRMTIEGVKALEDAVLNTPGIDGIVLRYGRLYGPGTWFDKPGGAGAADDRCRGAGGAARGHARRARHLQHRRGRWRVLYREGPDGARIRPKIQNALN